jgi:hypothetical protein
MGLVVLSEDEEPRTLLIHRISKDDIYQRQGARSRRQPRRARARAAPQGADPGAASRTQRTPS